MSPNPKWGRHNDRLEKALVANCLITVRPTVMSKVNHVAYTDQAIYGPSLPSADSSVAVVSYCRKCVHLDLLAERSGH